MKEVFSVKLKMIFVEHHFVLHQTPKNTENIFQKIFNDQTNRALNKTCNKYFPTQGMSLLTTFRSNLW
jgi:hypothetical protein